MVVTEEKLQLKLPAMGQVRRARSAQRWGTGTGTSRSPPQLGPGRDGARGAGLGMDVEVDVDVGVHFPASFAFIGVMAFGRRSQTARRRRPCR